MLAQNTTDRRVLRRIPIAPRWNAAIVTTVVFLFLLLSGVQGYRWYEQRLIRELRAEVRAELALQGNALSLALDRRLNLVDNVDALVRSNPAADALQETFDPYFAGLSASTTGLRAIVVAPEGGSSYVYPQTAGSRQLAQDLFTASPAVMTAGARQALQTGAATVAAPILLPGEQPAAVVQKPVYIEGRQWGFVYLINDLQPILANAGLGLGADPFQIAITDPDDNLIYGQDGLQAQEPAYHFIALSESGWQLTALPHDGWAAVIGAPLRVFGTLAFTVIMLATGMVYLVSSRQARLREAVLLRTAELGELNRKLELDIVERERMEAELLEARQSLEQRVDERTHELSALLEISSRIGSTLDLERLLPSLFEQFRTIVDFNSVAVSYLENEDDFLLLEYSGPAPQPLASLRWRPGENDPPAVKALSKLKSNTPLIIPDVHADTPIAQSWRQKSLETRGALPDFARCWMGIPLVANERNIGMLAFEHEQPAYYTERHAELAMALANHAAVAIENARLFKLEQRRSEQFRLIGDVSRQITAILALDEVANQAAHLIQQAFGFSHVHIGLLENDEIIFRAAAGVWRDERECHLCNAHRFIVGKVGASGHVAATGEPLIVPDVRRDPYYLPMTEDQVGSALSLPLKVRRELIGVLNVDSNVTGNFDAMDIRVLQPLANQLAIALENARLYEQSRALAALQERQKLARELHDSVSQSLYGIGLGARTAIKMLEEDDGSNSTAVGNSLVAPLEYVLSLATTGLAEMRALIFELRPESLEVEGVIPALTRRVEALRARHEINVETTLEVEPDLPVAVKEVLYRFTQEALHNVVKHANAAHARVTLAAENGDVVLEVSDDGQGFNPQDHFPGHLGLKSMRERVEGVGGVFSLKSAPGHGTTVRATVRRREGR